MRMCCLALPGTHLPFLHLTSGINPGGVGLHVSDVKFMGFGDTSEENILRYRGLGTSPTFGMYEVHDLTQIRTVQAVAHLVCNLWIEIRALALMRVRKCKSAFVSPKDLHRYNVASLLLSLSLLLV